MQREFPEVPLVGVGAIIIEDGRVVLVKRLHPPLQAEWSIPGGVLEVGELVREAAIREQQTQIAAAKDSIDAQVAAKVDDERGRIAAAEAQKAKRLFDRARTHLAVSRA